MVMGPPVLKNLAVGGTNREYMSVPPALTTILLPSALMAIAREWSPTLTDKALCQLAWDRS